MAEDYSSLINSTYQNVLGRDADADGAQYWAGQLATGAVTPDNFLGSFVGGAQGTDATAANNYYTAYQSAQASPYDINSIYQNVFDRGADAEGLAYWGSQANNATSQSQLTDWILSGAKGNDLAERTEYLQSQVPGMYTSILDRTGDATGQQYWTDEAAKATSLGQLQNWFLQGANTDKDRAEVGEYGLEQGVDNVYNRLFGRSADQDERNYWVGQARDAYKTNPDVSFADISGWIRGGAQSGDALAMEQLQAKRLADYQAKVDAQRAAYQASMGDKINQAYGVNTNLDPQYANWATSDGMLYDPSQWRQSETGWQRYAGTDEFGSPSWMDANPGDATGGIMQDQRVFAPATLDQALSRFNQSNFGSGDAATFARQLGAQLGLSEQELMAVLPQVAQQHRDATQSGYTEGSNYQSIAVQAALAALANRGVPEEKLGEIANYLQPFAQRGAYEANQRWKETQKDDSMWSQLVNFGHDFARDGVFRPILGSSEKAFDSLGLSGLANQTDRLRGNLLEANQQGNELFTARPDLLIGMAAAIAAPYAVPWLTTAIAPAVATAGGGATTAGITAGAAYGAGTSALGAGMAGRDVGDAAWKGAVSGGIASGVVPATAALQSYASQYGITLSAAQAAAITRVLASGLGAGLTENDVLSAMLGSGISGISGLVSDKLTGNAYLDKLIGSGIQTVLKQQLK